LIKSLQDENAKLKQLLQGGGKVDPSLLSNIGGSGELKYNLKFLIIILKKIFRTRKI
jgi:hypothetical protein